MGNTKSTVKKYEPEDRWQQIVVSVGKNDNQLKAAMRSLAEEEDRSISKQICIILNKHLRDKGRL